MDITTNCSLNVPIMLLLIDCYCELCYLSLKVSRYSRMLKNIRVAGNGYKQNSVAGSFLNGPIFRRCFSSVKGNISSGLGIAVILKEEAGE